MKRFKVNALNICQIPLPDGKTAALHMKTRGSLTELMITMPYKGAYGMGEKYNGLNQKGKCAVNQVEEKFCDQGEKSYYVTPFFLTDSGFGLYVDTMEKTTFEFLDEIHCTIPSDSEIVVFTGTPETIISEYMSIFGQAKCPPEYAFGPWISANHWNSQEKVKEQLKLLKEHDFPATVIVLEAWSDESTFYIFNGARYQPKAEGAFRYEDFDFTESLYWKDPKGLIEQINQQGLHLVLWQIPVYKQQTEGEYNEQNERDRQGAIERGFCVKNKDGTPYVISEGHWFAGSLIPDFTNPAARKAWFSKRQYLLDLGVSGFKTDGGEFIYTPDVVFADGTTGKEGKNQYCQNYLKAYTEFIGDNHVLFSRAGFAGVHTTPIHWAGDQQSTNEELKNVLQAGLSAAMTGMIFWGFDIGGFAGPLPSMDLYRRATQLACFCPIMQWHSEPCGGQFKEILPGAKGNNERSPWNLAAAFGEPEFIEEIRYWHRLRIKLLPYIYHTAIDCAAHNRPMMRPLVYEWVQDLQAIKAEDEFCLGEDMLIAPLLEAGEKARELYLPEGDWYGFFSKELYEGGKWVDSSRERFPVFICKGGGIALEEGRFIFDGQPIE